MSCPTPSAQAPVRNGSIAKKLRGSKDMSCTLGILQEPEGRYKTKSIFCQCPLCINQPFKSRCKKKTLYRLKSGGGSQVCLQTIVANSDETKSSAWSKGNLGTEISTQIFLTVTSVSHSIRGPVPGNRPVPAAGIDVCVSMSWSNC